VETPVLTAAKLLGLQKVTRIFSLHQPNYMFEEKLPAIVFRAARGMN